MTGAVARRFASAQSRSARVALNVLLGLDGQGQAFVLEQVGAGMVLGVGRRDAFQLLHGLDRPALRQQPVQPVLEVAPSLGSATPAR